MSEFTYIADEIEKLIDRNNVLELCSKRRGERLRIMKKYMCLGGWHFFLLEHPEAKDWFDRDGEPK